MKSSFQLPSLALLVVLCPSLLHAQMQTPSNVGQTFSGCNASEYYSSLSGSPSTWTLSELRSLTAQMHRMIIPQVSGNGEDIYGALINLYPGDKAETVHLVFRNISMADFPYANTQTWSRGDMWPISRGANRTSPAITDIHMKQPADSIVLMEWNNLFFGECGTVVEQSMCSHPGECPSAWTDGKIWTPPDNAKGEIARQLLYGVLRYGDTLGLELVDCPPFTTMGQFGYKSALLQWHLDFPVTAAELQRNNLACENWQGNRNPFVDYPDLVTQFFGQPDTVVSGTLQYSKCNVQTQSPTAAPNACNAIQPGDIQIILVNSGTPDQIVWFTLNQIPAGVDYLYVTDDAWDGHKFMGKEGTIKLALPAETTDALNASLSGLAPGYIFSYGFAASPFGFNVQDGQWETVGSIPFQLDDQGDTILTYCIDADGNPRFINGFSYAPGGWAKQNLTNYTLQQSALPDDLVNGGNVQLPYFMNYVYIGPTTERVSLLVTEFFNNPSNYSGSNTVRKTIASLDTSGAVGRSLAALIAGTTLLVTSMLW